MQINSSRLILPIVVFILGMILTKSIIVGVVLAGFAGYLGNNYIPNREGNQKRKTIFGEDEGFISLVLLLSAAVIKADGRIYKKELDLVKRKLEFDFTPNQVNHYMAYLNTILKKRIRIDSVCHRVNRELDYSSKIQLLHFLTGLTVTNGIIIDSEFNLLRKIATLIEIPYRSLVSILAMFQFTRQHAYNKNKNYNYKSYSAPSTSSQLTKAYKILELETAATADEIKKAYRKLAKIHHPDRVTHLGPEFQKNAKIKFQKIADAYDLIKDTKGFK